MNKLVIATGNQHKVMEIKDILEDMPIDIVSIKDLNIHVEIEEDGSTFEENAFKKAYEVMKITGLPTIADDSGLEVDALNGAPGVYSARFAGVYGDDKRNNEKLLELLKDVSDDKRGAKFVSVIVLIYPNGEKITARGEIQGYIGHEPKGNNGFGYDPLFIVPEYNKTFAQLSSHEKNKISHRGKALSELKRLLEERN